MTEPFEKTLEVIQIELGKLHAEVSDIKSNHLKHLWDKLKWCNIKINFILIFIGLILAGMGLMIALLSFHVGR